MTPRDDEVQLSAQRLRELMLWHGKDEGNLPPAATLVNLSRDTIAALTQFQQLRDHVTQLRLTLAEIFWNTQSSVIRREVLAALGAPPDGLVATVQAAPVVSWAASPNGLPRAQAELQQATA